MNNLTITYKNIILDIEIISHQPRVPEMIDWKIINSQAPDAPTSKDCQRFAKFTANSFLKVELDELTDLILKQIGRQAKGESWLT